MRNDVNKFWKKFFNPLSAAVNVNKFWKKFFNPLSAAVNVNKFWKKFFNPLSAAVGGGDPTYLLGLLDEMDSDNDEFDRYVDLQDYT